VLAKSAKNATETHNGGLGVEVDPRNANTSKVGLVFDVDCLTVLTDGLNAADPRE
jgi:hypothetical protein